MPLPHYPSGRDQKYAGEPNAQEIISGYDSNLRKITLEVVGQGQRVGGKDWT